MGDGMKTGRSLADRRFPDRCPGCGHPWLSHGPKGCSDVLGWDDGLIDAQPCPCGYTGPDDAMAYRDHRIGDTDD